MLVCPTQKSVKEELSRLQGLGAGVWDLELGQVPPALRALVAAKYCKWTGAGARDAGAGEDSPALRASLVSVTGIL